MDDLDSEVPQGARLEQLDVFVSGAAAADRDFTVEIVCRSVDVSGVKVLPRRWLVERTFGWMTRWRRFVCDYEKRLDVSEAMIHLAMTSNLLRRLTPWTKAAQKGKTQGVVTAQKQKRVRCKVGDIVRIDLGSGRHAYAQVADEPLVIFFEGTFEGQIAVERIPSLPVAFRLWVSNHAIAKGTWPVIGSRPLLPENAEEPFSYKQDAISGRLSLYHSAFVMTNYERPAALDECQHLECAAEWEPEHVADRLIDHAADRPNRSALSLRIDATAIPA